MVRCEAEGRASNTRDIDPARSKLLADVDDAQDRGDHQQDDDEQDHALAAAAGYCSSDIWFAIISADRGALPAAHEADGGESPITSVTTKIEPMAMPGLASGMMTF